MNSMRALIVDDEEDIGFMTRKILKNKGIQADDVQSIKQAIQKINNNKYALFFLDLNLPDGSGFDLVPLIKNESNTATVIIISAHDGVNELQKAEKLGINVFLKKPFTKNDIYQVIDEFIK